MEPPRPFGRIKGLPEDFVVEELPAYSPSGVGEHVFVRLTKTDRTTMDAVRAISRELGCDARTAGFAGMKDRRARTTQTISLQAPRGVNARDLAAQATALRLDGIEIHEAVPHGNKLKPGHLAGNRFAITVREVPASGVETAVRILTDIARTGFPNAFGAQRFGARGDNADRARAWLRGDERGPRNPRMQRLLWSSLQSAVFNAVLSARVSDGTWTTPIVGDLLKRRDSGGLFVCSDVQTDRERALTGEVSPTGPIVGARMRSPEGVPAELEQRIAADILGDGIDLARTRSLGEGTRRALRVWVDALRCELLPSEPDADGSSDANASRGEEPGKGTASMRVHFVLPKGAYATTVLAAAFTVDESRGESGERDEHGPENGPENEATRDEPDEGDA
jgi:tRNA pseudouridine13 synthase